MKKNRPVNLDLMSMRFPITAIVSILHRASGVLVFLMIPLLLWALSLSLRSPTDYQSLVSVFQLPFLKLLLWIFLSALAYHLVAGIRHLLMDMQLGETKEGGKIAAKIVMVIGALLIIGLGIWLW